jgi:hypothetical protein
VSWLIGILEKVGLNWLWGKASELLSSLWEKISRYRQGKKNQEQNKTQADIVEEVRQRIIALKKAGQPVPPALEKELDDEVAKLVSGSIISTPN